MADRPYTLLSAAVSLDGYVDGGPGRPLRLSNDADFDRVDGLRAAADAILVGANTVRGDNPRLEVRSAARRAARVARGRPDTPLKVVLTRRDDLDPRAAVFSGGAAAVYRDGLPLPEICADLYRRGVRRLMVEGGGTVHTGFLTADLADELQLVVAPVFVGDPAATRFAGDGRYPWHPGRRAQLAEVRRLDDVVVLRYALSPRFGETDFEEV